MARDGNGRDHKAAGRPDGGQYEEKAGQGLDDDLEEVPTTAESVAPDEGWWASLENDPEAAAGPEAGREPEPDGPAAGTGGDAESEDGPWWIVPGDDAPEVREAGRSIVNAPSREAARALLKELPEDFRCAIIRSLPFGYKAALIDLTPNPDERNDPFSLLKGLPYSADDAKAGRLRDLVAKGDVRAAVALTVHGDDKDREWLASLPMAKRPVVGATLRVRGKWPEKRKAGVGTPAPETEDARTGKPAPGKTDKAGTSAPETKDGKDGDGKTAAPKDDGPKAEGKDGPKPADPVADALKELEGVGDVMKVRAIIARRPRGVRVAVVRAQPFDRISMLADLTGDPDKARGYRSMLDGLPYTKDSPRIGCATWPHAVMSGPRPRWPPTAATTPAAGCPPCPSATIAPSNWPFGRGRRRRRGPPPNRRRRPSRPRNPRTRRRARPWHPSRRRGTPESVRSGVAGPPPAIPRGSHASLRSGSV